MRPRVIAVIGSGEAGPLEKARAFDVGRRLAKKGCIVVTGGLGGAMAAASRGAKKAGGFVVGIVPGSRANRYVDLVIATEMGDARNTILANTAEAFVAVGGSHGTLSEIAFALKRGKRVIGLGTWAIDGVQAVMSPDEAVREVLRR